MKQKKLIGLGIVMVLMTCGLMFFAITSYPEIKAIEEREQYLESLPWYVPLSEGVYFSSLDYGCRNKIIRDYSGKKDLHGLITPEGVEIVPCIYEGIIYKGGELFAALTEDEWLVFDFQGKQLVKLDREDGHLYYAGGKYFVRYPDFQQMGFEIVDGENGQVVKSFDDCYSCLRLLDGSWYISKTSDIQKFDREMINEQNEWVAGYEFFEATELSEGFFVDKNFEPMYGGQNYQLVIAGDGYRIANRIEEGDVTDCVFLDGNGEKMIIPPSALKNHAEISSVVNPAYGLFVDEDGNVGVIGERDSENYEGTISYYNQDCDYISKGESSKKLIVFYDNKGRYQLRDSEKNILLKPYFSHIEICGDGTSAEVAVDGRSGIVNLKAVI